MSGGLFGSGLDGEAAVLHLRDQALKHMQRDRIELVVVKIERKELRFDACKSWLWMVIGRGFQRIENVVRIYEGRLLAGRLDKLVRGAGIGDQRLEMRYA